MISLRKLFFTSIFRDIRIKTFHTSFIQEQQKKEFVEKVHQFSQINVNLRNIPRVKIIPFDLLDCPDANILRATATNDTDEDPRVSITVKDNEVTVQNDQKLSELLLEIPVKADLTVNTDGQVEVSDLHSDKIAVISCTELATKNLRSESIQLHCNGNINCRGLTLGYKVNIKAEGSVSLEKVQGEELQVDAGDIHTESCYSTNSKFTTQRGNLVLNNVHRNTEVNILEKGDLTMCGFNGTLLAKVRRGKVNLQLAELWGENVIITNAAEDVSVNVSDAVVASTYVHAAAEDVHVDDNLQHLLGMKENGATTLGDKTLPQKLFIQTEGRLDIKKLSWADAIKLKM